MGTPAAPTFDNIRASLKAHRYAPVYILHGEEGFFTDELVRSFEAILPPDEREFNLYVLHAPETDLAKVGELCHRMPMMAERQVVLIKEAQATDARELAKLAPYVATPVETTVLVIACRGAQIKGKELLAAAKKSGAVVFESKKVREQNAPAYIGNYIRSKGLTADPKALEMLCEFVGTDLSRLYNEVDKLATLLPSGAQVTPEVVERNIGVSRQYNAFELTDALAEHNGAKAFRILGYFRANPKAVQMPVVAAAVFNLFADLLTAHYAGDKSEHGLMEATGIRYPMGIRRLRTAMRFYNAVRTVEIISAIRNFDAMSKGVNSRQDALDLFHGLIHHILTAPGRL